MKNSHDLEYGSAVYGALRAKAGPLWAAYVDHAFVRGLGDGSLPKESFLHYLRQDYVFLIHFSRAWGLAVAKSAQLDEMRPAATIVDALLNHEMALHVETCAGLGISEAELFATQEQPENLAYTRFVLDAGYSGDFLDLVVALAPCVMGYGEIGARLGAQAKPSGPYAQWIETYAGDAYQDVCRTMARLIETASAARLGGDAQASPRWAGLQQTFSTATRLEVGFWEMGLRGR